MALKSVINGEAFNSLPADVQKEYKKDGDNYVLDVDGIDDHPGVGALRNAMTRAKEERTAAQTEARTHKQALETAQNELDDMRRGAIPKADVTALEASWKTKLETAVGERDGKITKLTGAVDKALRQAAAQQLASDVFLNPSLGLPHVLPRLKVEEDDSGELVVKVLGADGKPSASTMEDFKKELLTNKDLAPILRGTRASGGGAGAGNGGGGAPSGKDFDAAAATPQALAAHLKQRKQAEGG